MPLGVEVRLGPRHIVLDGDPAQVDIKGQFCATLVYLVQFSRSKFNQGQHFA